MRRSSFARTLLCLMLLGLLLPDAALAASRRSSSLQETNVSDEDLLMVLFAKGTAQQVSRAINKGLKPTMKLKGGMTPLELAAAMNTDPEVVRILIRAGAKPNAAGKGGMTPLLIAAMKNENLDVVSALAWAGANPNVNVKGMTVLFYIIHERKSPPQVIDTLLRAGADPNTRVIGVPPLVLAIGQSAPYESVASLIRAGADVKAAVEPSGMTALTTALVNPDLGMEYIHLLLEAGADPSAVSKGVIHDKSLNGLPMLVLAAMRQDFGRSGVDALLRAGANPRAKVDGASLASAAEKRKASPEAVRALKEAIK